MFIVGTRLVNMKTRNGFVSNSSSSSFLVASEKDADEIVMSLTLSVNMKDLTEETIDTKEALIKYYGECWGYTTEQEILSDNSISDEYKRCTKALKEGKKIHIVVVSSDGGPLEAAIYDMDDRKLPDSPHYKVLSK